MPQERKGYECLTEQEREFRALEHQVAKRIKDVWNPAGFDAAMEIDANDDIGLVLFFDKEGVWSAQLGMQSWEIGKKPDFEDLLDVYAIIEQNEDYLTRCATPMQLGMEELLRKDYLNDKVNRSYLLSGLMKLMEEFIKEDPPKDA